MDASRQLSQLGQHALEPDPQAMQLIDDVVVVCCVPVLRSSMDETGLSDERDEVLLHPIVDVALDAASFVLLDAHQLRPRRRELVRPVSQLCGQPDIPDRERSLSSEGGDDRAVVETYVAGKPLKSALAQAA